MPFDSLWFLEDLGEELTDFCHLFSGCLALKSQRDSKDLLGTLDEHFVIRAALDSLQFVGQWERKVWEVRMIVWLTQSTLAWLQVEPPAVAVVFDALVDSHRVGWGAQDREVVRVGKKARGALNFAHITFDFAHDEVKRKA